MKYNNRWHFFILFGIFFSFCLLSTSSWAIVLRDIEDQSPDVWGISINNDKYIPRRGGIKVCKEQNMIIVGFYLSDSNLDFYSQKFSDGNRKPLGFEIDINDVSGVFNRNDIVSVVTSFPDHLRYDDNPMGDDEHLYTLGINDPTAFIPKIWHLAAFHFSDHVDISKATFEIQLQLVGDVRKLRDDYHDIYNGYGVYVEMQFWTWFNTPAKYGGGEEDVYGNNFFGIRPSEQIFHAENFFVGGDEGYDRFLWNWSNNKDKGCGAGKVCDYEPYDCSFGSDPWNKNNDNANNNSGDNGNSGSGNGNGNGGGSENANGNNPNNRETPPEQEVINGGSPRNNGDPDMKISTVNLSKGANSKRHHELEQDPEEKFYAYAQIKNVGTGRAKDFKVKFYIDGGKKNFNRDDEDYQDSVRIEEFNSGAEIRYSKELTSPTEPGTYWVYACITSIDEDSDMGNNCSDEDDKEEYGKLIIVEPPPVPSDLIAHSLRLKSGETTLPGGRSFGFTVTVNNIGAGDAESNFQILYEKNGPSTGYVWKPLGESRFSAVPLYAGSSEEHSTFNELAAAPTEEGDYRFRSCVDSGKVISESNEGNNCSGELEIEVLPSLNPSLKPVYRFWSDQNQSHFYTISETEKNNVINDYTDYQWRYERIAWCAYSKLEEDSLPVYRFWSDTNQSHFYTISETEKNKVVNDYPDEVWKYERIEWYAFDYAKAGTIPVYRFWSDKNMSHFYTASETEKQNVIDQYTDYEWKYEHVGWWVYPCP